MGYGGPLEDINRPDLFVAQPAAAPLTGEVDVSRALDRLGESTIGIKSEESELVSDIRIALRHIASLSRRVAELEAELSRTRKHAVECDKCFCLFVPGGRDSETTCGTCLKARAEAAEAKCQQLEAEVKGVGMQEFRRLEGHLATALAKSARLGRKLQRLGLHLDETRRKLRKVEGENREKQGRAEALEAGIADALKQLAAPSGEPCPTCNTHTHKGWCPVPTLQDLLLGTALAAVEAK